MSIFSIFSAAIVFLCTGYTIILVYRNKKKLANFQGLLLSMVIAVITGLLSGSILGMISGETFLVVGASMIIGFVIGFLAGHPIGLLAILMGSISGLMGGIIGGILGVFLQFINPTILLGILLGFYVIIMGFVIAYIFVEINQKLTLDTEELSPSAIIAGGVILLALFLLMYSSDMVEIPGSPVAAAEQTQLPATQEIANTGGSSSKQLETSEIDVSDETTPIVKMTVTEKGYSPNVIRVKKGIPVKLEINNPLQGNSCLSTFMIPDFNVNGVQLNVGVTVLTFTPNKDGNFTFSCGMQMYKGTIIVE